MKIDRFYYPVVIVAALVFFLILALALGFTPSH
jgi:hypothetical protein